MLKDFFFFFNPVIFSKKTRKPKSYRYIESPKNYAFIACTCYFEETVCKAHFQLVK